MNKIWAFCCIAAQAQPSPLLHLEVNSLRGEGNSVDVRNILATSREHGRSLDDGIAVVMMKLWFALLALVVSVLPASAADWMVDRVRGSVAQQVNGAWLAVARGDVIPSNRVIKTGSDGRAELRRNAETISLQADTQIRLGDAGNELMTTVYQQYGVVSIQAERRNVQHFSVQTRFLAAVVKGTRFTVRADAAGASVVVERGIVQVQDTEHNLVSDIRPGQEASVTTAEPLNVTGAGNVAVYRFDGQPVVPGTTQDLVSVAEPAGTAVPGGSQANAAVVVTTNAGGNSNGAGNSEDSNAGGNANIRAEAGDPPASVGNNGNGNSNGNNAGGNSNGAGKSEDSNAGGRAEIGVNASGSGVSVSSGNSGNGNSNGNNAGGNSNGAGKSENNNAGGNGNGNAGGNGNGNGKKNR